LSLLVKLSAVVLFALILIVWPKAASNGGIDWSWLKWPIAYIVLCTLVQAANSLWQRDPEKVSGKKGGQTTLYLRSFLDDRQTTLTPGTWLSSFMGVDPPVFEIEEYSELPLFDVLRRGLILVSNHHPLRLLRLLFNRQQDSSEEQIGHFLAKYGAFVAIGKPGERFATTGASRMYVGNDEWQKVVHELMDESQIVLLQPAATEGIWWEVGQSIQRVAPERLVFCMVNYRRRQNDYESFRERLKSLLPPGASVPKAVGCHPAIAFLRFDQHWNAIELPLLYYPRPIWPFRAINFGKTLRSYLVSASLVDERGKALPAKKTVAA
jgi:hypothetical protein